MASKLVADPSITVGNLYQILDRFLTKRGTNDLVALLKCMQGLGENDSPTKFGPTFLYVKELLVDLIQWAPNCMLPRLGLNKALNKLNGDRRWHFANRSLDAAATDVEKDIRCVFGKLREIATTSEVFHRFVAKATPQEYQALDELMGYVDLKNTFRGSSRVFQKECLQHDEAGLRSIFDKVLNLSLIHI